MGDEQGEHGTFRQVEDWLRSLGLICYAQSFYDNGYENLDICRQIQEQDLAVIGIDNVKDKSDILAGVCRLKQKAVYFELEPEEDLSSANVPRKYDPFLLITLVKAELENDNVQLTEPPYFYPVSFVIFKTSKKLPLLSCNALSLCFVYKLQCKSI